jgi:hypothetical protein
VADDRGVLRGPWRDNPSARVLAELSPIELVWNQNKARLRRRRQCSPAEFHDVLKAEIESVTYEDIKSTTASIFDTCGYSLT